MRCCILVALMMVSTLGGCDAPDAAAPEGVALQRVNAAGTTFDPPVVREAIPDGNWICDMDTVHYARPHKGNGLCPICRMELKLKGFHRDHPTNSGHSMH